MSSAPACLTAEEHGDVLVLVAGLNELREYDRAMAFECEMKAAVGRSAARHVVLDLQSLAFMSSVGLLALLGLRACVKQRQGTVVLCNLSDVVLQTLTVSQLLVGMRNCDAHFQLSESRSNALAMIQGQV